MINSRLEALPDLFVERLCRRLRTRKANTQRASGVATGGGLRASTVRNRVEADTNPPDTPVLKRADIN